MLPTIFCMFLKASRERYICAHVWRVAQARRVSKKASLKEVLGILCHDVVFEPFNTVVRFYLNQKLSREWTHLSVFIAGGYLKTKVGRPSFKVNRLVLPKPAYKIEERCPPRL